MTVAPIRRSVGHLLLTLLFAVASQALWAQARPRPWLPPTPPDVAKVATHEDFPQLCTQSSWNASTAEWDSVSQSTYTYDLNGHMLEEQRAAYLSGQFVPDYRQVNVYDVNGWLIESNSFQWNGTDWDTTYRATTTYDGQGRSTLSFLLQWDGTAWDTLNGEQIRFTYHNSTELATEARFIWQPSNSSWQPIDSMAYFYSAQDQWDTVEVYGQNFQGWAPFARLVDWTWADFARKKPTGYRKQEYFQGWQDLERFHISYGFHDSEFWRVETYNAPNWDTTRAENYIHDLHDHEVRYEYFSYASGWTLQAGEDNAYAYDLSGHAVEIVRSYYDTDSATFLHDRRFQYANFFVGQPEPAATQPVRLYPNPASDRVTLEQQHSLGGTLQLMDLAGQLVLTQPITDLVTTVPLSLPAGVYLYRFHTRAGQSQGRLVIHAH